jgi:hypothetical protein
MVHVPAPSWFASCCAPGSCCAPAAALQLLPALTVSCCACCAQVDADVIKFLRMLTFLPLEEIDAIEKSMQVGPARCFTGLPGRIPLV